MLSDSNEIQTEYLSKKNFYIVINPEDKVIDYKKTMDCLEPLANKVQLTHVPHSPKNLTLEFLKENFNLQPAYEYISSQTN